MLKKLLTTGSTKTQLDSEGSLLKKPREMATMCLICCNVSILQKMTNGSVQKRERAVTADTQKTVKISPFGDTVVDSSFRYLWNHLDEYLTSATR